MTEVVTYKRNTYCQLKLDSGERILISCAQTGIKIMQLRLGGLIPAGTIASWSISEVDHLLDVFLDPSAPENLPLDAIKKRLMGCRSIAEIRQACGVTNA